MLLEYFVEILGGALFGMSITFERRLFHRPLLVIFLLLMMVAILLSWLRRRAVRISRRRESQGIKA
jgi:membrane protein DedA with SNARE-associated domain